MPQVRPRVFVCGRRTACFTSPMPVKAPSDLYVKRKLLRYVLSRGLPEEPLDHLTPKQRENLEFFKEQVDRYKDNLPDWCVCTFDLYRGPDGVRAATYRVDDNVMCLTTKNNAIWLHGISTHMENYNRVLTPVERARVMGIPENV
eukprot:8615729-Pyramimonas_sp.AAC.1